MGWGQWHVLGQPWHHLTPENTSALSDTWMGMGCTDLEGISMPGLVGPGSVCLRLAGHTGRRLSCFWGWGLASAFSQFSPNSLTEKGHSGVSREASPLGHHKQQVKSQSHSSYPASSRKILPLLSPSPRNCRARAAKVAFSMDQSQGPLAGGSVQPKLLIPTHG